MIKNIYCLINFLDFFLDISKEVMLFVISFISNIVFYIIEYMVNRLFFCIKNVIILGGYFKKNYIYNI